MSTITAQATNNSDFKKLLSTMKGHLLFGTSHMLPFIVAGGVLLALAVMASGKGAVPADGLLADISNIGIKGLVLFPIILGGFIGYSIADKPALAPAMISSGIMADMGGGFLGCIVAGFIAGGVVFQLKKIPLSANMTALGAYFIYPLVGTLISAGIVLWGIGEPIKIFMASMNEFLASMAGASKVVLGTILGGMTAFDMGGPINKVATLFAQTQVDTQPWLMGGVGIAICTPPLGMALATFLFKKKFTKQEQEAGKAAAIMGSIGISEGAIPFAANDPVRVLPSIVAGGIVGCVFGFLTDVLLHAPWGGLITAPVSSNIPMYVVGIALGSLTTAVIVGFWKPVAEEEEAEDEIAEAAPTQAQAAPAAGEGEYDIVAVTCCPSGVAHTFMAAKALEKAGAAAGLKIKVETQGQNGIQNRITDLDVENAKLVILAHDIQVKDAHPFAPPHAVDCSTKDALRHAATRYVTPPTLRSSPVNAA
ncbi:fructose-specific PTS transporter subunit EIIC, partial [Vibrio parahaemolyticus]|uniref:fructose-specific PTS transporter subunit EIIC n=1 Tax=Vibrio parahaemolyticus TaxID=670 RepID=UPI001EEA48C4